MTPNQNYPIIERLSLSRAAIADELAALGIVVGGEVVLSKLEPTLRDEKRQAAGAMRRWPFDDGVAANYLQSRAVGASTDTIEKLAADLDAALAAQNRPKGWRLQFEPGYEAEEAPIVTLLVPASDRDNDDLALEEELQDVVNRRLGDKRHHVVVAVADAGP